MHEQNPPGWEAAAEGVVTRQKERLMTRDDGTGWHPIIKVTCWGLAGLWIVAGLSLVVGRPEGAGAGPDPKPAPRRTVEYDSAAAAQADEPGSELGWLERAAFDMNGAMIVVDACWSVLGMNACGCADDVAALDRDARRYIEALSAAADLAENGGRRREAASLKALAESTAKQARTITGSVEDC